MIYCVLSFEFFSRKNVRTSLHKVSLGLLSSKVHKQGPNTDSFCLNSQQGTQDILTTVILESKLHVLTVSTKCFGALRIKGYLKFQFQKLRPRTMVSV